MFCELVIIICFIFPIPLPPILTSSIDDVHRLSSLDVDGLIEYKYLMNDDAQFFNQSLQSHHNLTSKPVLLTYKTVNSAKYG